MVLDWTKVDFSLQVREEFLPQAEELKYLRVLFTSENTAPHDLAKW